MGSESVKYLKAYLSKRGPIQPGQYVFVSHGTEKKANTRSISNIFAGIISGLKAQGLLDFEQKKQGKPRTLHLYCLRKFFRKYASQAGNDYVQYWMGHSLGVDEHYFSHDVELHRKEYAEKAMPHLRIEQATPLQHDAIIENQQREIERLKKKMNRTSKQLTRLMDRLDKTLDLEQREYTRDLLEGIGTKLMRKGVARDKFLEALKEFIQDQRQSSS